MPPFLQYTIRRLLAAIASGIIITMLLYAGMMIAPPEERAMLYVPNVSGNARIGPNFIPVMIEKHHLDDPYIVQYAYWVGSLFDGTWGYSPVLRGNVLPELLRRTPATLEIGVYSLILLIPLGLLSGLYAGWRPGKGFDGLFRGAAYLGTSIPPFIFAMFALAVFYVKLRWFAPGRMDSRMEYELLKGAYTAYTGAMTIDGLLNGRLDVFFMALRHLAMPIMTLSMFHWATLGRITRAAVIDERGKEYIIAARGRGVSEDQLIRVHALRPILAPSLTAIALSAASVVTGIFVSEIIFSISGVSQIIVIAMQNQPDAAAALGFAVYSVLMVIGLMFIMDLLQAWFDPRVRDEVMKS